MRFRVEEIKASVKNNGDLNHLQKSREIKLRDKI